MIRKVLIPLLFPVSVLGQDFAVTSANDTVPGTVTVSTYDIQDRIDVKNGKKKSHFTAVQIKALVIKGETYHPVRTEKGYRMMKLVTPGYASLYLAHGSSGIYDTEYIVLRNGSSMEVPGLSFKRTMANFLSDCSSIKNIIEKDDMTRKKLGQLLGEYNKCIEGQTQPILVQTISSDDPLMVAINDLKNKLETNTSLKSKNDALDVLKDIHEKVRNNQPVPNYLMEGLKDYLKEAPEYEPDIEKISTLLKVK